MSYATVVVGVKFSELFHRCQDRKVDYVAEDGGVVTRTYANWTLLGKNLPRTFDQRFPLDHLPTGLECYFADSEECKGEAIIGCATCRITDENGGIVPLEPHHVTDQAIKALEALAQIGWTGHLNTYLVLTATK